MKQLHWHDLEGGQRFAHGPYNRDYWVTRFPADHPFRAGKWCASHIGSTPRLESYHDTPEEAMAACQEHISQVLSEWLG